MQLAFPDPVGPVLRGSCARTIGICGMTQPGTGGPSWSLVSEALVGKKSHWGVAAQVGAGRTGAPGDVPLTQGLQ